MLTMQDVLLRLTDFWASRGCVIAQPMNTEVGAGTLNPATFLRVLGPEPWRVAYVEPSVRPDDSRYGENPNRLQMYDQYQVILKPEPGDAQQLYLESLCALGIDIHRHDVRFVEDDWAQPAIGAWGLGWEVWLDGLEITQFTYFQQAGGIYLDPVPVEITYGVERIVMALQGVTHFRDITYALGVTYGEAFGQAEYEMSRYYLDDADIQANRALFELYLAEARRLLELRLPVPAYSYILKCSHAFNVLDARGSIGTTERARTFAAMRQLAQQVATLWAERRAELGHPLGSALTGAAEVAPPSSLPEISAPATLAFEIGVEEMPAGEVLRAQAQVGAALTEKLSSTRLAHGTTRTFASPRRIAVVVEAVEPREAVYEEVLRGPRASAAFDAAGQPTQAAAGFARKHSVDVVDLQRRAFDGTEHVVVVRQAPGRTAAEVLVEILPEVVRGLRAEKNMRWNAPGLAFTRPIRWLLCLLGDDVVPFHVGNVESGRSTRGLLTKAAAPIEVGSAGRYLEALAELGVEPDFTERKKAILEQAVTLARAAGGVLASQEDSAVVDEVANLCEQPVAAAGRFEPKYMELPAPVLTTVMKKHQRYLPVRSADGTLLPHFVAVADGPCDTELVRSGNEAVLRARYEDALFFWHHDLGTPLERMTEKLASLTFEERLGSMADRAQRIAAIATELAQSLRLGQAENATLARAAELVKFDLGSQMVMELTSLAGVMAREYALSAGEPPEVADALVDMEQTLPSNRVAGLLALADRADLLGGMFAIGAEPTGSSDPFGLRRAALGVNAILGDGRWFTDSSFAVSDLLTIAGRHQPVELTDAARDGACLFVLRRLEQSLLEQHPFNVVQAVLPIHGLTPWRAQAAAHSLKNVIELEDFQRLATAIQRVIRIVPLGTAAAYDPNRFAAPSEHELADALAAVRATLGDGFITPERFRDVAMDMVQPIDQFFEREEMGGVLVMASDPAVRANRLGLLAAIAELAGRVLDWRAIE